MAPHLPQEILSLIVYYVVKEDKDRRQNAFALVQHVVKEDHGLTPYTLVNKSWQAAFERELYSSVVVLSPSDVRTIMVSPNERRQKRGLSFARLDDITSGPQHWRQSRRTYIQRILYRVAVPYWINPERLCSRYFNTDIWDSSWRRENNQAFSKGIRSLFEYLSTWTDQDISLDIALQGEMGYYVPDRGVADNGRFTYADFNHMHHEPETSCVETHMDPFVPPYNADFLPDWHLPKAKCVTHLGFPKFDLAVAPPDHHPESENGILVPAVLQIASACGALRKIELDGDYEIGYSNPTERKQVRDATAAALTRLPSTIQHVKFTGDWLEHHSGYDGPEDPEIFQTLDTLSMAFRNISTRLKFLHITEEAIFCELLCLDGTPGLLGDLHWPHLETIRLSAASRHATFESMDRYWLNQEYPGSWYEGVENEMHQTRHTRYSEDLFESLGYATQRMPRLKNALMASNGRDHSHRVELTLSYHDGRWMFSIMAGVGCTYEPSSRVLQAWKLTREDLQFRTTLGDSLVRHWKSDYYWAIGYHWEATYTSWPPLEL
jgi:hypothetical protein